MENGVELNDYCNAISNTAHCVMNILTFHCDFWFVPLSFISSDVDNGSFKQRASVIFESDFKLVAKS